MFSANMNNVSFEASYNGDRTQSKRRRFVPSTPIVVASDMETLVDGDPSLLHQLNTPSQQEIEAQLLQVGMRIRKSVNDGYQNTPGGLHNVGALAMQPLSTATFCGINLAVMAHISSATPISEQKMWSYSTASKRRQFDDDSDSDDSQEFMPRTPQLEYADRGMAFPQDCFNISNDDMSDVSPMTQVGQPKPKIHGRKIAQPKSKIRSVPQEPLPVINPFAQISAPRSGFSGHRRMTSCGMEAMMDFGEASFLQPRQDVEMDWS